MVASGEALRLKAIIERKAERRLLLLPPPTRSLEEVKVCSGPSTRASSESRSAAFADVQTERSYEKWLFVKSCG